MTEGKPDPKWLIAVRRRMIREWAKTVLDNDLIRPEAQSANRVSVDRQDFTELLCMVAGRPLPLRRKG